MRATRKHMLSVKFDEDIYTELSAATEILGSRSIAAHIHSYVLQSIREAKANVTQEEFTRVFLEHRKRIRSRSNRVKTQMQSHGFEADAIVNRHVEMGNELPQKKKDRKKAAS